MREIICKITKKKLKIALIVLASIILILACIPLVLQNSKVQNFVVQQVKLALEDHLQTKINIRNAEFKLFNTLVLNDVYAEDRNADTLFVAKKAALGLHFREIFRGRFFFTNIEFDALSVNLKADSAGNTNIDFIIEAFKTDKKPKKTEFKIRKLGIKNSSFTFSREKKTAKDKSDKFDFNDMAISNINAEIVLNEFYGDTLNAEILNLSFMEKSGFALQNFAATLNFSAKKATVDFLQLKLPNSSINFENITAEYDTLPDLFALNENLNFNISIKDSYLTPYDISSFFPDLAGFQKPVYMQAVLSGIPKSVKIQDFKLQYADKLQIMADCDISGLSSIEEAFVYAQIKEIKANKATVQDLLSSISRKPVSLPEETGRLGTVTYSGNVTGFLSNLVAYGKLYTEAGNISTDILLQFTDRLQKFAYSGSLQSDNLNLSKLLDSNDLGLLSFKISTKGKNLANNTLQGTVNATINQIEFKNYLYNDLKMNGKYDGTGFDGEITLDDRNIQAQFKGIFDFTNKIPVFNFDLLAENVNLHELNLIETYPEMTFSLDGKINMEGNSLDNFNGNVIIDNPVLSNKNETLNLGKINLESKTTDNSTVFTISSKYINGSVSGDFKYSTLNRTISSVLQNYLPSLSGSSAAFGEQKSDIKINLNIEKTSEITGLLDIPYSIEGVSNIKGIIDEKNTDINVEGNIPSFTGGGFALAKINILLKNSDNRISLDTRAQANQAGEIQHFVLNTVGQGDSITGKFGWQNTDSITNAGEISAIAKIRKENSRTTAQIDLLPTEIIINDSLWNINRSNIAIRADSTIHVSGFRFGNSRQYIEAQGIVSNSENDALNVQMNDIDLDYIFRLIKLKGFSIGGFATGEAKMMRLLKEPAIIAKLDVKDVALNHVVIGDAVITSTWDNYRKAMVLEGSFFDHKDMTTVANGVYVPKNDSLDLTFDAAGLTLSFLNPFLKDIMRNIQGLGYGKLHLFGPTNYIKFEGDILAKDAQLSIDALHTTYFFSDTIRLRPEAVNFDNIRIYDIDGNQGTLNGYLNHNGQFLDLDYRIGINVRNFLSMNTQPADSESFYGKVYATGDVLISGNDNHTEIRVNAVPQQRTKCYISLSNSTSAAETDFIRFINPQNRTLNRDSLREARAAGRQNRPNMPNAAGNASLKIDMQLAVNPNAEIELIIDPDAGDAITARGNGNLRLEMASNSSNPEPAIKLYGTYTIESGDYLFTLQTLFMRRKFIIDTGSSITWSGDPLNAQVNIKAIYPVKASLADLLGEPTTENRVKVPVNCVLTLAENLMSPVIKLDIDLPTSDEGKKQQVKDIVSTAEMMNRQIAYLLLFNTFYNPQESAGTAGSAVLSVLSSTVGTSINSILQNIINTDKLNIGMLYSQSELTDYEIGGDISYNPNSRIIVTVSGEYRSNVNTSTNSTPWDYNFDVEWLLNNAGNLRAKGYRHSIERLDISDTAAFGAGLAYKEEFESIGDMLRFYVRMIFGKKRKEKKEDEK